jgi:hypothetical protein
MKKMKKWSELKHTTRCVALCILLLAFCSCGEIAQDGIVSAVEEASSTDNYKYKVEVKKFVTSAPINGGDYYWFWTNDTLMVGDTVHIGKVNSKKTITN